MKHAKLVSLSLLFFAPTHAFPAKACRWFFIDLAGEGPGFVGEVGDVFLKPMERAVVSRGWFPGISDPIRLLEPRDFIAGVEIEERARNIEGTLPLIIADYDNTSTPPRMKAHTFNFLRDYLVHEVGLLERQLDRRQRGQRPDKAMEKRLKDFKRGLTLIDADYSLRKDAKLTFAGTNVIWNLTQRLNNPQTVDAYLLGAKREGELRQYKGDKTADPWTLSLFLRNNPPGEFALYLSHLERSNTMTETELQILKNSYALNRMLETGVTQGRAEGVLRMFRETLAPLRKVKTIDPARHRFRTYDSMQLIEARLALFLDPQSPRMETATPILELPEMKHAFRQYYGDLAEERRLRLASGNVSPERSQRRQE